MNQTSLAIPCLTISKISKTFGKKQHKILSAIDWSIYPGEHWLVVGANGAGKSTLLRLIAGYWSHDSNEEAILTIHGIPISKRREALFYLGYVPEHFNLPDTLTGRDWLGLFFQLKRCTDRDFLAFLIDRFDIANLIDKPMASLSKGQKQRLCLVQALMNKPKLLLLDEALNGLDPLQQSHLLEHLKQFHSNASIIHASHEIDLALSYASNVLILHQGHLLARFDQSKNPCTKKKIMELLQRGLR